MIKNSGFDGIQSAKHRDSDVQVADHWLAEFRTGKQPGKQQVEAAADGLKLSWGTSPRRARLWQDLDREWTANGGKTLDIILSIVLSSKSAPASELLDWAAILRADGRDWTICDKFSLSTAEAGARSIVTGTAFGVSLSADEKYRFCVQFRSRPATVTLHHIFANVCPKTNGPAARKSTELIETPAALGRADTTGAERAEAGQTGASRPDDAPAAAVDDDAGSTANIFSRVVLGLKFSPSDVTARWHRDTADVPLRQRVAALLRLRRQLRQNELRSYHDIATFTAAAARGGSEPLVATLLWKLLRNHAYVENFQPGAGDDLLSIYGLGPEEVRDQLVKPLITRIGCRLDPQPPPHNRAGLATPRDVVRHVAAWAAQQRDESLNGSKVQPEPVTH